MQETGNARILNCRESTAGDLGAVYRENAQAAPGHVGLQNKSIVAGSQKDAVKIVAHMLTGNSAPP